MENALHEFEGDWTMLGGVGLIKQNDPIGVEYQHDVHVHPRPRPRKIHANHLAYRCESVPESRQSTAFTHKGTTPELSETSLSQVGHAMKTMEEKSKPNIVKVGHKGLAFRMFEKGANLNVQDSYGFALTQAIRAGYEELAIKMVECGADPNVKDSYGFALTQAIRAGYEELAIKMVECGADPNVKDSYGFALTQAIRAGYEELAIKMVECGADPNVKDSYGFALTQAIRASQEKLAVKLVEGRTRSNMNHCSTEPLVGNCKNNHPFAKKPFREALDQLAAPLATELSDISLPKELLVEDAPVEDSVIEISGKTGRCSNIFQGDAVNVKNGNGKKIVMNVAIDHASDERLVGMNAVARENLQVRTMDAVTVELCQDIGIAQKIAILPMADTTDGIQYNGGQLFNNFLRPYLSKYNRPLQEGDRFLCGNDDATELLEFKVVEMSPETYGWVNNVVTNIHCEGAPLHRSRGEKRLSDL